MTATLPGLTEPSQPNPPSHTARLAPRKARLVAAAAANAETALGELAPGCRVFGFTKGQFSILDLIRAVLRQTGPADLVVSTWSTGIREAENVQWLRETGNIRSCILLTDRSFPVVKPENGVSVEAAFGKENIRITNTHAKFALIRNERWNIAIRSSMNLNRNPRFEQFDLDDDAELCDFMQAHVDELLALMPAGLKATGRQVGQGFAAALGGGLSTDYGPVDAELQALIERVNLQAG